MEAHHQELLDHCREFSEELLEANGEIYPFGAFIGPEGRVHPMEVEINLKKVPSNGELTDTLEARGESEVTAGNMQLYALTYEVSLQLEADQPPTDAFAIDIRDRSTADVPIFYFPYTVVSKEQIDLKPWFAVKR
ncbi:MAG: hypothetical protein ACFB10_10720 [Salibacteraceae bacterium]